jgi:hypothetical protein
MLTRRHLLPAFALATSLTLASVPAASADGSLTIEKHPTAAAGTVIGQAYNHAQGTWGGNVIDCGADCSHPTGVEQYCYDADPDPGPPEIVCEDQPTLVRLSAAPAAGWALRSITGCTQVQGHCQVSANESVNVTATFEDVQAPTGVAFTPPPYRDGKLAGLEWTFTASASDNWGIDRVELLFGETVVATSRTAPYALTVGTAGLAGVGSIDVSVRAVDLEERSTRTPATTLLVDVDGPQLRISGPGTDPGTAERQPRFEFELGDAVAGTVECSVDSAAFDACESPVAHRLPAPVADGTHTLRVKAADARGNVTIQPHAFRVDATVPETTITSGREQGAKTNEANASFAFGSSETGGRFECRLDDGAFTTCTTPHATGDLPMGTHTFSVRAIDAVGNVDPSPVTRTWTIVADLDGDGFDLGRDCDDNDATRHPGAADTPENGRDEDCDGADAVVLDRDRDGYNRPQDCNDADSRINPGARDAPGDRVDDDCDGAPAAWPRLRTMVRLGVEWRGVRSKVVRLELTDVVRGSTVTIACKGRGCPFASRRLRAARNGKLRLNNLFKRRRLAAGTRIQIAVRHPQAIGPFVTYVTRVRAIPSRSERCLVPGVARPRAG